MRVLFVLAACSFLLAIYPSNSYPEPQPKAENKPTTQDKRGTQESPLIIHGDITTKAAEKTERDRQQEEEKIEIERSLAKYAGWTAVITGVLVLVTGVLAFVTYKLWTATNKLVIGADNTARHELRAYMGVERVTIQDTHRGGFPGFGKFTIRNFGKTMAKDAQIWIVGSLITVKEMTDFPLGERKSKQVIMPNESIGFHEPIEFETGDLELFNRGIGYVYLWGRIEYTDVFGEPHWTTFRFVSYKKWTTVDMTGWNVKTCEEGNDAT